ncbi:MAG: tetratricopeptide repeat protein [Bacteroidales bacterium]|jgi:tetratricopeptide (TPR) repeat protein
MKPIRLITLLAAVLFPAIAIAQTEEIFYYPEPNNNAYLEYYLKNFITTDWGRPKNVSVFDDRIELKFKNKNKIIYFSDLLDYSIKVIRIKIALPSNDEYQIRLKNCTFSPISNSTTTSINGITEWKPYIIKQLADDLFFIQYQLNEKRYSSQLTLFEPIASQYRALKVKPPVSEEQRKYIVQANALNQQKMYDKAIELYNKANELDQTAYPAAYSNLALLSAQVHKFDAAIYYMKKYLLLEPDASDARSAQDKIYEWEIMMHK